jgi:mRNA interferase MazF
MKRGEIYFATLDPTLGSETKKTQPFMIISNDASNAFSETVTVIPLTSQVKKVYPFEVFLPIKETFLDKESKAQCHQIRTLSKKRFLGDKKGHVSNESIKKIENALRIHLGIS